MAKRIQISKTVRIAYLLFFVCTITMLMGCSKSTIDSSNYNTSFSSSLKDVSVNNRLSSYAQDYEIIYDNSHYDLTGISASTALLMNIETGKIIMAKNSFDSIQLGSMVRLLLGYYTSQRGEINDKIAITSDIYSIDASYQSCHFTKDDIVYISDLLYASLIFGAYDVSVPISMLVSGSVPEAITALNGFADELGMSSTNITNLTGQNDEVQQTSLYDIYLLLNKIKTDTSIMTILDSSSHSCNYTSYTGNMAGINLVNYIPYFFQGKTTASGLKILGGMCDSSQTSYPVNQMLVHAEDINGNTYFAFVAGAESYDECFSQIEEILTKTKN